MNEIQKTGAWALCGIVMLSLGIFLRPSEELAAAKDDSGQPFYPEFEIRDVTELEITAWDKKPLPIKLIRRGDLWQIDTHEGYPTDADNQLARATSTVVNMIKGVIVSETQRDHKKFGVIDPPAKGDAALDGVGTRVTLKNAKGEVLTSVIIGKEADLPTKSGETKTGLRYVRRPDQDRVYQSKVDLSRFSTKFSDWIQTDLLDANPKQKFEPHSIKNVAVNNYSVLDTPRGPALLPVENLRFAYDNKAPGTPEQPGWTMRQEVFDEKAGEFKPVELDPATEELDYTKLNDMRNALRDLKIEDVHKKPAGLSKELKAGEAKLDIEHLLNLKEAGYLVTQDGQVMSKEGQMVVGMEDGTEYVLRFGAPTEARGGVSVDEKKEPAKKEDSKKDDSKKGDDDEPAGPKETRYLLVSARFNPKLIPEPTYETVPEEKAPEEKTPEKPAETAAEKPAPEKQPEAKQPEKKEPEKAAEPKKAEPPAKKADEPKKAEAAKDQDEGESCQDAKEAAKQEEAKQDDSKKEVEAPKADAPKADSPKAEAPKTDVPKADAPKADAPKADAPKADAPKTEAPKAEPTDEPEVRTVPRDPKEVEKARITRSNDIKRVEWEKKVADGKKKVEELNFRFADWYYVISEDVFKKIRVERAHLIKPKKSEGQGNTPADFDALKGGLPKLPGGLPGIPGLTPPAPKKK